MSSVTQPATVLVVDDDRGLSRLIQRTLQRAGFSAETASSGKEAMDWLVQKGADLMLLDLKLQDMEGKELVNRLSANQRSIPFIVITGQGDERVAVDMMKRGALDYVAKDNFLLDILPEVVKRALATLERDRALAASQANLRESEREILEISEREQRRIGADLHDNLGQQLTGIELLCVGLKTDLAAQPSLLKQVDQVCELLRKAIGQVRSIARGLAPVNLHPDDLRTALAELAEHVTSVSSLKCRLDSPAPIALDDLATAGHLYRIAQEAVNNALKHSKATEIIIRVRQKGGELQLQVSDNGRGLQPADNQRRGLGMGIMKHRASTIGAELEVKSKPGKGVTVTCVLRSDTKGI